MLRKCANGHWTGSRTCHECGHPGSALPRMVVAVAVAGLVLPGAALAAKPNPIAHSGHAVRTHICPIAHSAHVGVT